MQIQSSAKPLVPYPVGISVQPQSHDHRKSRFAEESDAADRPAMTPHPIKNVHTCPQVSLIVPCLTEEAPPRRLCPLMFEVQGVL